VYASFEITVAPDNFAKNAGVFSPPTPVCVALDMLTVTPEGTVKVSPDVPRVTVPDPDIDCMFVVLIVPIIMIF
jgi:hypothetical protein